ncbi:MAG TPA: ABC transporter substrate-binding protein [Betaproteobacteria bacterium]|nr:ABC transporter substrate-binding protein [Betaproteobacteria bacterium]
MAVATPAGAGEAVIRVGMTPAFLSNQYGLLADWRTYLEKKLGRRVEFVERDSYRKTIDLLRLGKLDFAWVCDYPYVYLRKRNQARLLAVPYSQGRSGYRAYLIVPARDTHTRSLLQLKGKIFAYADPYSNSGYLVPRYQLHEMRLNPDRFFKRSFFTYSHRAAIEAVAAGVAQGASVDSFVWDSLAKIRPQLTAQTRIVSRSPEYGFPPFVASRAASDRDFAAMRKALLNMNHDARGIALLRRLNLDGFKVGDPAAYGAVADMMNAMSGR